MRADVTGCCAAASRRSRSATSSNANFKNECALHRLALQREQVAHDVRDFLRRETALIGRHRRRQEAGRPSGRTLRNDRRFFASSCICTENVSWLSSVPRTGAPALRRHLEHAIRGRDVGVRLQDRLLEQRRVRRDRAKPEIANHTPSSAQIGPGAAARTLGPVTRRAAALARKDRLAARRISRESTGASSGDDRRGARRRAHHRAEERHDRQRLRRGEAMRRHRRAGDPGLNQLRDVVVCRGTAELLEQLDADDAGAVVVMAAPAVASDTAPALPLICASVYPCCCASGESCAHEDRARESTPAAGNELFPKRMTFILCGESRVRRQLCVNFEMKTPNLDEPSWESP